MYMYYLKTRKYPDIVKNSKILRIRLTASFYILYFALFSLHIRSRQSIRINIFLLYICDLVIYKIKLFFTRRCVIPVNRPSTNIGNILSVYLATRILTQNGSYDFLYVLLHITPHLLVRNFN